MPALTIFSMAIGYMRKQLLQDLLRKDARVTVDEICWVLTVPAIWSDAAKQFMREAAINVFLYFTLLNVSLQNYIVCPVNGVSRVYMQTQHLQNKTYANFL